ncbi:hypothetical protein CCHR01_11370 [Colletotrichum chrysophilum]|uniref:Uncharacterized protein n=1 Tax=Colletotrichum chrysophilum TaxID=1836956 RepID=A0AAD9AI41_9PEZI|nr:hypothetical protein CCHR01_11370 [Colletotrichum chrysophilum]
MGDIKHYEEDHQHCAHHQLISPFIAIDSFSISSILLVPGASTFNTLVSSFLSYSTFQQPPSCRSPPSSSPLLPSPWAMLPQASVPRNFIDGKGSALFGNVGKACSVGSKDGECDRFGRCVQEIPPNEVSVLNQGQTVDTCTAGGQTGTL